jgi:hypothetical protein
MGITPEFSAPPLRTSALKHSPPGRLGGLWIPAEGAALWASGLCEVHRKTKAKGNLTNWGSREKAVWRAETATMSAVRNAAPRPRNRVQWRKRKVLVDDEARPDQPL